MSLQTDSSDLLGGYRPLEMKHIARPLYLSFVELFTSKFSRQKNASFLNYVNSAFEKQQWKKLSQCLRKGAKMGINKVGQFFGAICMLRPDVTCLHVLILKPLLA